MTVLGQMTHDRAIQTKFLTFDLCSNLMNVFSKN